MVAHFQTISKMPASLPQWKLQVLSQYQVWQDQVVSSAFKFVNAVNSNGGSGHVGFGSYQLALSGKDFSCEKTSTAPWSLQATQDASQMWSWSCRREGLSWFPNAKVGSIEIYASSWTPTNQSRSEALGGESYLGLNSLIDKWYADISRFEGTPVNCKKTMILGDSNMNLDAHLCVVSHEDSSNLNSAIFRVARRDAKEPMVVTAHFRGFGDKNLASLLDKYVKSIRRAP